MQQKTEVEQQETERVTKENAQRRFDEYWAAHPTEKIYFESEKNGLSEQIISLEKEKDSVISSILNKTKKFVKKSFNFVKNKNLLAYLKEQKRKLYKNR